MADDESLQGRHDLLLVDLDGVVYVGDQPVANAATALNGARNAGIRPIYVTNNAARPPETVLAQLTGMGLTLDLDDIMTAAIAAAERVAARYPAGSKVLVVGGAGVRDALRAAGLTPVDSADPTPVAVVQGFAPEVAWPALAEAAVAIRAGAHWVATNLDATLPSPRGPLPGNGSLVAVLSTALGIEPEAIGKPEPGLYEAAIAAAGASRPLVIGDRLDTDIAGAHAASLPSVLVLTGVSNPADLLAAKPGQRPTYIGRDLSVLAARYPPEDGLAELRELADRTWSGELPSAEALQALSRLNINVR